MENIQLAIKTLHKRAQPSIVAFSGESDTPLYLQSILITAVQLFLIFLVSFIIKVFTTSSISFKDNIFFLACPVALTTTVLLVDLNLRSL